MNLLTLEGIKETTHAFDSFVTVENSNLPDYYKQIFPKHCQCGGEVIMTIDDDSQDGYTQLQCCNPDCWVKMAYRFSYFCKTLGFKGFGPAGALTLYAATHQKFKYPSFLCIFDVSLSEINQWCGDAYANEFANLKDALHANAYPFQDAIASLGIPDIGKGSRLFDVVKSPVALMEFILKKRINELCEAAGIYALKSRYFLEMHKIDIITLMSEVMPNIMSTPKHEVYLAITGSVVVNGEAKTRAQFIWMCESLLDGNGNPAYKLVETKSASKLEYVVADAPSTSSKYSLGKQLNILITAQDFYDMLVKALKPDEAKQNDEELGVIGSESDS